jgi:hypothetical protein
MSKNITYSYDAKFKQIAVGQDQVVYALDTEGNLWVSINQRWVQSEMPRITKEKDYPVPTPIVKPPKKPK